MTVEVRKLVQSDIDYVRQNPLEDQVKSYPYLEATEYCYTGLINGDIIGVGGVRIFWEGVGEGWLIFTKDVTKHGTKLMLCLRRMKAKTIADHKLRRFQAIVRQDFPKAQKMLESLGFVAEGIMEQYLPDGTAAIMYAWVTKKAEV